MDLKDYVGIDVGRRLFREFLHPETILRMKLYVQTGEGALLRMMYEF